MAKIRLTADGELSSLKKTCDVHGECPALSVKNSAPAAFSLNQSRAVCLPLVTENQKLIWVMSDQIQQWPDAMEELETAFDRFPYLTHEQTAALAWRCSLHPDQVKKWFMLQRLHYGISWDYGDIMSLTRKFKSSPARVKEGLPNRMRKDVQEEKREEKTQKRAWDKAGDDTEVEEDESKKWKGMVVKDKMGKKRRKRQAEGVVQEAEGETIKAETTRFTRKGPAQQSLVVRDGNLGAGPPLALKATSPEEPPIRAKTQAKTQAQQVLLRKAFIYCQYPDGNEYDSLETLTGFSRHTLVHWFADMRYYVKKGKPGWMTRKQHSRALTNIKHQQLLRELPATGHG